MTNRRLRMSAASANTSAIQKARIGKASTTRKAVWATGSTGSPSHQPTARDDHPNSCTTRTTMSIGTQETSSRPRNRPTTKARLEIGRLSMTSATRSRWLRVPMSNARNAAAAKKIQRR